jgi:hypothetical protein
MKKAIPAFLILCFLVFSFNSAVGFSTLSTRIFRPFDINEAIVDESSTITVSFVNQEGYELRIFYYTEQIPEELWIDTVNKRINASDISYLFESGSSEEIYFDSIPYLWIPETPTCVENNPILGNAFVEIAFTVSAFQPVTFDVDEFSWVAYYETATEWEQTAFGHNENIVKHTRTFIELSNRRWRIFRHPSERYSAVVGIFY